MSRFLALSSEWAHLLHVNYQSYDETKKKSPRPASANIIASTAAQIFVTLAREREREREKERAASAINPREK